MGIVESFSSLPQPVKLGIAGAAAGGLLVAAMNRKGPTPQQAAQSAQLGPVVLPPGADSSNGGELQQNTLSLVQGLLDKSQAANAALLAASQSTFQDALAQQAATSSAALQSSNQALTDQLTAQNNNWLAMFDALKKMVNGLQPTPVVANPAPGGAPPGGSTNPPPPASGGTSKPGSTMFWRDIKSWVGTGNDIGKWLAGSSYGLGRQYKDGQWVAGPDQTAGTKDYNTSLVLPVNYSSARDTYRGDFSGHTAVESSYSAWTRHVIDVMQNHPELNAYDAGMMELSRLKRDFIATGKPLYTSGFDLSSVPDNYGKGTYWI